MFSLIDPAARGRSAHRAAGFLRPFALPLALPLALPFALPFALPVALLGAASGLEAQEASAAAAAAAPPGVTAEVLGGLKLRSLGPALTSGRVVDIAVDPRDRSHWYVAVGSGGVWETRNRGTTWTPIFDQQPSFSIGCLALDPTNPLTLWVGTGENNAQRSVSYGDGVYKSTDGGKTWTNVGLVNSEHIGKIVIDPRNSNRVFVAAQGPLWSPGGDRGLYLTADGGATWKRILEIDEHTGVTDLVLNPANPDHLVAASYQRRRHVWGMIDGGPGSAVYRSTNGGTSWTKVSGLPAGDLGRVGLAQAPTRPEIVYAVVEAQPGEGGYYRSTDGGATWSRRSGYVSRSPQYYQELVVDPHDCDRVYSMDVRMQVSEDGGATWQRVGAAHKHVDDHALWIDDQDTRHLIAGCDGGVYESHDRGATWEFKPNLPITQFYRVSTDSAYPFYNIYGGTQDNFTLGGPSRTTSASGITNRDWFVTLGGDGFETVVDPRDEDIIYSQSQYGGLVRYDRGTGEAIDIKPRALVGEGPLRWNWNAPLIISPHSNTRLYFAANYLYRTDDRGNSWEVVGEDLTRQIDRNQLPIMDRTWSVDAVAKNQSTSAYGNVVCIAESPVAEGRLYAGTDDGLLWAIDAGTGSRRRIESFPGVPDGTYVSSVTASQHAAQTVYATFENHKRGDFKPYVLQSTDAGLTWTSIAGDLPERGSVHVLVEDHVNRKLLFCGTEFGLFVTLDGGSRWHRLSGGMPPIAVRDLDIQRQWDDLVVATFGRGIYVLDDYSPLRRIDERTLSEPYYLFEVSQAWRFTPHQPLGLDGKAYLGDSFFIAENPPFGAVFTYHVKVGLESRRQQRRASEAAAAKAGAPIDYPSWDELRAEDRERPPAVLFSVTDMAGKVVRRFTGPAERGIHRVAWDLRWGAPAGETGPLATPGRYQVSLATLINGVVTPVAGPEEFDVVDLPGAKFPPSDPAAVLAFQQEAARLHSTVQAAAREAARAAKRIDAAYEAMLATPAADPSWLREAQVLRADLADLRIELEGDPTMARRHELQPASIHDRVAVAAGSIGLRLTPTKTQEQCLRTAARSLETWLPRMRELEAAVEQLEQRVEQAGGPPAVGVLPTWKN